MFRVLRVNACPAPPNTPATRAVRRVLLQPDGAAWERLLRRHTERRGDLNAEARRFREQLGLPSDRPIVMSGHQAEFWHPGVLAKLLAANALAARTGAAVAWLVVDQDTNDADRVPFPSLNPRGEPRGDAWVVRRPDVPDRGHQRPVFMREPFEPTPAPRCATPEDFGGPFDAIADALRAHRGAPNAAVQTTNALFDLVAPITARPVVTYASAMAETDLFARVIKRMSEDAAAFQRAYNDAVLEHPAAGVRTLTTTPEGRIELPIWVVNNDGKRLPGYRDDLMDVRDPRPRRVVPRGMLMTAMMRLAGCDLFVHGTGGSAYEPINDHWLGAWLGHHAPAPFVTASADVALGYATGAGEEPRRVTEKEIARAKWRAHHAAHHPGEIGDAEGERRRRDLARAIEASPRKSAERAALFAELHDLLASRRAESRDEIVRLELDAELLEQGGWAPVTPAQDRSWPAVLHDPEMLERLRAEVDTRFG